MLKSFKTEINPTAEQKAKINKTIGVCRYIYNFYIAHNKALYDKGEKFMTGKSFSVWLNNEYIPNNSEKRCFNLRSCMIKANVSMYCRLLQEFTTVECTKTC